MSKALVITTIAASTHPGLRRWQAACAAEGASLWVIGDQKTPSDFALTYGHFFSYQNQQQLPFALRALPPNHYARKNIGYLLAIQSGCAQLLESDDDNHPLPHFWQTVQEPEQLRNPEGTGWINAYGYFTEEHIWPRGFPPELAQNKYPHKRINMADDKIWVFQGLADHCPDVDAIFHLGHPEAFYFLNDQVPLVLQAGQWCPFNSQATAWQRPAFPLLYLPVTAPFRLTDIWRSLIGQRILWEMDASVAFLSPTVRHERNQHALMRDLADEYVGYLQHQRMAQVLEELRLQSGYGAVFENLRLCYGALVGLGWLAPEELLWLELWQKDLEKLL
ncbi:MAG: STELLO glycosyltransferase family protein [Bernardetiaceae bacterium]